MAGRWREDATPVETESTVLWRVDAGVAYLVLNRPERLNAWTPEFGLELLSALDRAAADQSVRAVVITGAGRAFSAGADLKSMAPGGRADGNAGDGDGSGDGDLATAVGDALRQIYNPLIMRVRTMPKPVIASVNGVAAGIGCSLAIACDLVVASESASFLLAFANIGLTLDGGASALLVAKIGHARASEMALLATPVSARQALSWGVVNSVVADDELAGATTVLAARLAAGAPGSYAAIKRSLNDAAFPRLAELLDREAALQQSLVTSQDFIEGVTAFLQKRPPNFTGN